ncbi:hypothetical protein ABMY26_00785 (plasmid) [Azospirillum sp. HJ39]|uniref:hypothetical protein n=1 Tax=Azospirillum sp. HJ39 TaxID=3159496 RepID=UPI003557EFCC
MSAQVVLLPSSTHNVLQLVQPQPQPQRGPSFTTKKGDKFDPDRDLRDIAKLVRQDINSAVDAGLLPSGTKCSVRIERYSMGQTLHVRVTECPIMVVNPIYVRWHRDNPHACMIEAPPSARDRFSPEGRLALSTLEHIVESYNRRVTSDQPDDYSSVRFHTDIAFAIDLRDEQTKTILALQPKMNLRNSWKPAVNTAAEF